MAKGHPKGAGGTVTASKKQKGNGNGANLGFEAQLFLAADKLRKNLEPSDCQLLRAGLTRRLGLYFTTSSASSLRRFARCNIPLTFRGFMHKRSAN